jgi:pimeloyl-ACP methyl ester carboxylesterase
MPFLERLDAPAIALDLPGWGYSESPGPRRFDYSMGGLARFFERFLETLGVGEHSLVVHDWGSLALIAAQRRPDRVRRLVLINAVPLLPGYRWHWVARYAWRVPVVGELVNATTTRASLRLLSRQATPRRGPLPEEFIEMAWRCRRSGAWPAMLRLYRSADPEALARAGERLGDLTCAALIAWGTADPYIGAPFGRAYAARLGDAALLELADAGHWPWLERPDLIDRVVEFVASD